MENENEPKMKHHYEKHFDKSLSIVTIDEEQYFIGVQIANTIEKQVNF